MRSNFTQIFSKIVLGIAALYFLYLFSHAISIANRRHMGTEDGTYVNNTRSNTQLQTLALKLTQDCVNKTCQVQNVLDYVSNIPYKINHFQAHTPQKTIQENFGDCDDKSNLLISLLHQLNIKSYFVLVPKHIFVIVSLDSFKNKHARKALYLNGEAYYILESTAPNSPIGFPLRYKLNEIKTIIEPFKNKKIPIKNLEWKL